MSINTDVATELRDILRRGVGGVAQVADDLLLASRHHVVEMEWSDNRPKLRIDAADWSDLSDIGLKKSIFRAIVARIAILCNEQSNSAAMSPYGGNGELMVCGDLPTTVRVTLSNTPNC
jgi:hypothetical protein